MGAPKQKDAVNLNTWPKRTLNRELEFRPHTRWLYYGTQTAAFALWVVGFIPALDSALRGHYLAALVQFSIGSIAPLAIFVQSQWLVRPLAFRRVWVEPTQLRLLSDTSNVKETIVPLGEIRGLKVSGSSFQIETVHSKVYRFSAVLERVDYILETIHNFAPKLLNEEEWWNARTRILGADHRWARFFADSKAPVRMLFKRFFVPTALVFATRNLWPELGQSWQSLVVIFAGGLSVHSLLSLTLFFLNEKLHARQLEQRLMQDSSLVRRDLKRESQLAWLAFFVSGLFTAVVYFAALKFYWNVL